jgi:acetylornithine deacetylase/succinyl-diaminopimelate desuccinylase-like protein
MLDVQASIYQRLREENERLRPRIVGSARDLLGAPSGNASEKDEPSRVQDLMGDSGYDLVVRDDAANVVGVIFESCRGPTLLLSSHTGSAPGGPGPSVAVGALLAQVFAGSLVAGSHVPRQGNLVIAATPGDADGPSAGAQYLLQDTLPRLGLDPTFAILGRPTSLGLLYWYDTWIALDVQVKGPDPSRVREAAMSIFYDHCKYYGYVEDNSAQLDRSIFTEGIRGGLQGESDPSEVTFRLPCRLQLGQTSEECADLVRRRAAALAEPLGAVDVDIEEIDILGRTASTTLSQEDFQYAHRLGTFLQRSQAALAAAGWRKPGVSPGQLERRLVGSAPDLLVNKYRVPTLAFGPGHRESSRAQNAPFELGDLVDAVFGTAVLAYSLIGVPVTSRTGR